MTAELVAKLGAVDYRGDRPCIRQDVMLRLVLALDAPRQRLVRRVLKMLKGVRTGE